MVNDWQAAVDWFHRIFGLPILWADPESQYALVGHGDGSQISIKGTIELVSGYRTQLTWESHHIARALKELHAKGATIVKEITKARNDWYLLAEVEGPEGIRILLWEFDNYDSIDLLDVGNGGDE